MISRKTLAGLMVGASVSALFLAASPLMAVELEGNHGAGPVVCTQEFGVNHIPDLEISDDFVTTGDVIIDCSIGPDDEPLEVEEDGDSEAVIGGTLIIAPNGFVTAWDADAGNDAEAEATAVDIDSDKAPKFRNDGVIEAEAEADAAGTFFFDADADAEATGIEHDGENLVQDDNNGLIDVDATATAITFEDPFLDFGADAEAEAEAVGIDQDLDGDDAGSAQALGTNGVDGVIEVEAHATGVAEGDDKVGEADAEATGIEQEIDDFDVALAQYTNDGLMLVTAEAIAKGEEADADAEAIGIDQDVDGDTSATARFANTGTLIVSAEAEVRSTDDEVEEGEAEAEAIAVEQEVEADDDGGTALATSTNTSSLTIGAIATAFASGDDVEADAEAQVAEQDAEAGTATTEYTNSGVAFADAYATVVFEEDGDADADATTIDQWVDAEVTGNATFTNDGIDADISATAVADAIGFGDDDDDPDGEAEAEAVVVSQQMDADGTGTATVTNDGLMTSFAQAHALSLEEEDEEELEVAGDADADAEATVSIQEVDADSDGDTIATVSLTNTVTLVPVDGGGGSSSSSSADHGGGTTPFFAQMFATALATATAEDADADAFARIAEQDAEATTASTEVINSGIMESFAGASAYGEEEAEAEAEAQVADQWVDADTDGTATVTNNLDSLMGAEADAYARAVAERGEGDEDIDAEADADANVNSQQVDSDGTGTATVTNDGDMYAYARAQAQSFEADDFLFPTVVTRTEPGIAEVPVIPVPVLPDLDGDADAEAEAVTNIQEVEADTAVVNLTNVGLLGGGGGSSSSSSSTHHGDVGGSAQMFATAYATATGEDADAEAEARIAEQDAEGITGTINVDNAGLMDAYAEANANGEDEAEAEAEASVIDQWFDTEEDANSNLLNRAGAVMSAVALANADATFDPEEDGDAEAEAEAAVVSIAADADGQLILNILNQGDMIASATANATGFGDEVAEAEAVGIEVRGTDDTTITGTTVNESIIDVRAIAHGAGDEEGPADADAIGIHLSGDQIIDPPQVVDGGGGGGSSSSSDGGGTDFVAGVRNSGFIYAYAEAFDPGAGEAGAGEAEAEGIVIDGGDEEEAEEGLLTVWNDAGAIVTEQVDEEEDLGAPERGTAIDTEDAPNAVDILLTGNNPDGLGSAVASERISDFLNTVFDGQSFGYIFGDIEISEDDEIIVTDGKTLFDGVINPEEDNDDGTLTIRDTGTLVMLQNEEEGPSDAHVDQFNLDDGGTLMVELTTEDDDVPGVEADTANVNGRIFALYNPGFYDDETRYEDVVETEEGGLLVGDTFNVDDNSALLITEAQIDEENDSIDLVATRQGFGEVDGLSKNAKAAGNAIEKVFAELVEEDDEDDLFSNNVKDLFVLADGDYQDFMDQLTGAEHAQYLQSVLWSTRTIKRTITERMECDAYGAGAVANVNGLQVRPTADLAPEAIGCFTPGTGHVWGRASGTWNNLDGDRNAPGYDETQISFTAGADYAFTDSFYAGIAGGWISSEMDFDNFGRRRGASVDYEGWHVAGYGGYDNRVFYLRGIVDFASYEGETHRDIKKGPSLIDPSSDEADSDVFNFYGEAGYRWEFSPNYTFTPFVGVDVGHAELDEFTENDPHDTGWALKVKGGEADSVETLVGVRFGGFWDMAGGMFRPDVMVAWAHEFDDPAEVDMAFREAPDAKFTVVASDVADDSLVAGVGGTFDVTNQLRFGIKWDGRFNEDYDSNSVIGRIEYKF